jgi:sigma-B regulation protein RsbU (phosphoserine phosphatase)
MHAFHPDPAGAHWLAAGTRIDAPRRMTERKAAGTVLVADDQPSVVAALRLALKAAGFEVDSASSVAEIRVRLAERAYDALIMDLNYARDTTSGREGLALIDEVHARDRSLPIVAMTGWGTVETAVEAMRRGACTLVPKPWDNVVLIETIRREIDAGVKVRRADAYAARELEDGRRIQRALLPLSLPDLPWCRMAAIWEPAAPFGGDCYDAFRLDETRIAFSIGDVCGKGLPAALLMSNLQASVRAFAEPDRPPRDVLARVNGLLCRNRGLGRFVSFFYAVLDGSTRTLSFSNAGHEPPLLVRGGAEIARLGAGGPVLGVFEDAPYDQGETVLARGDRVVLFTDGITEARGHDGDEFGAERLIELAVSRGDEDPAAMLASIHDAVRAFAQGGFQDDATLLAVGIDGGVCRTATPLPRAPGGPNAG